jgi:hypothetical protein
MLAGGARKKAAGGVGDLRRLVSIEIYRSRKHPPADQKYKKKYRPVLTLFNCLLLFTRSS